MERKEFLMVFSAPYIVVSFKTKVVEIATIYKVREKLG